jgi:hypothetical protein
MTVGIKWTSGLRDLNAPQCKPTFRTLLILDLMYVGRPESKDTKTIKFLKISINKIE